MVCISCILIPLALFVWHRFLQPILVKFFPSLDYSKDEKVAKQPSKCPFTGKETPATNGANGTDQAASTCPGATAAAAETSSKKDD